MCLSIPAKIISIDGNMAKVSIGGAIYNAGLQLLEDVKVDDYVLLHSGYAIQKLSLEEVEETKKLLQELIDASDEVEKNEASNKQQAKGKVIKRLLRYARNNGNF